MMRSGITFLYFYLKILIFFLLSNSHMSLLLELEEKKDDKVIKARDRSSFSLSVGHGARN